MLHEGPIIQEVINPVNACFQVGCPPVRAEGLAVVEDLTVAEEKSLVNINNWFLAGLRLFFPLLPTMRMRS